MLENLHQYQIIPKPCEDHNPPIFTSQPPILSSILNTERSLSAQEPRLDSYHDQAKSPYFPATISSSPKFSHLSSIPKLKLSKILLELSQKKIIETIEFLQSISIFSKWAKSQLSKSLYMFKSKTFTKGQYVFKQNDMPSHVYIVLKGSFTITRKFVKENQEKSSFHSTVMMKKFENKQIKHIIQADIVVKGEKEILGAEEVMNKSKSRIFSCICNTAVGEVLMVSASDFISKLLRNDALENYTKTSRMDYEWLSYRSQNLERSPFLTKAYDNMRSNDRAKYLKETKREIRKNMSKEVLVVARSDKSLNTINEMTNIKKKKHESINFNWASCQAVNIHMARVKKVNKRLAPPNFLMNLRQRIESKFVNVESNNKDLLRFNV